MLDQLSGDPLWAQRPGGDPLAPHRASFAASLRDRGYRRSTVQAKLRLVLELGQWLGRNDVPVTALED